MEFCLKSLNGFTNDTLGSTEKADEVDVECTREARLVIFAMISPGLAKNSENNILGELDMTKRVVTTNAAQKPSCSNTILSKKEPAT